MSDEAEPLMKSMKGNSMPKAPWAKASPSSREATSRRMPPPQAIAHRGYKASWPENTMNAFKGAVEVGAHAIETDTHLSADGVVVLAHDPSLKRCFGVDKKVAECTWDYLSTLETVRTPHQKMPRLRDLLEWLAEPGNDKIWVLLDIKIDDSAHDLIGAIATTLAEVPGPMPWNQRILLGCWNATFIETARKIMPDYALCHISFSLSYSRYFFPIANLGFNLRQECLAGWSGRRFMHKAQKADRLLFAWTVNEERWMEWCIRQNLDNNDETDGHDNAATTTTTTTQFAMIDGVITDDPKLYLDVCRRYQDDNVEKTKKQQQRRFKLALADRARVGARTVWEMVFFRILVTVFFAVRRFQGKIDYFEDRATLDRL